MRITLVALLALPALQPLFSDWFTCGYDNSFHMWRAVEVHNLLRQGVLYPRWAADMAHGYGFLLFNFVSPLSAYVAAGFHFAGLPWVRAVNFTFALGLFLSGLTMYLFVRDRFGHRAGLVSAVAYVYAPFQAYDVFNRGGMSEAFAWWLPPLVLWSLDRWHSRRGGVATLFIATASMAGLILTHNVFAFLFGPLMVGLLLLPQSIPSCGTQTQTAMGQKDDGRGHSRLRPTLTHLARGALPLALGLGLTTFFWLPGLVERDWVQTQRLLGVWVFDYRHNFLRLGDLLALPRVTDPALVNDWPPRALGLAPVLVALLPLLGWRRLTRSQRWLVALSLAGMVGSGLMTLPLSRPLWDHLPLLPYIQFPWRFLGPAAFCAAVPAGAAVAALSQGSGSRRAALVSLVLIGLLFLANQGWFFPDHCPPPADTTVFGMIQWEQATDTLGATAGGEYLPLWVHRMPHHAQLLADYASGGPIRRLEADTLPPGAEVVRADYGPVGAEIELNTPESFQARYLAFYYPGWRVRIDGRPVEVAPSDPHGLLTFDAPAGRHVIRVRFGPTPLRTAATALSAAALMALLLAAFILRRNDQLANLPTCKPASLPTCQLANLPYLLLALTLIAARFLVAQGHTPLRRTQLTGGQLRDVDHPYAVDFGHRWLLLGHDRLPQRIASDEALEAVLYWRALDAQGRDYAAALALVDASGQRWTQVGTRSPRWHRQPPPVYTWPDDGYALTAYLADLLPGTPPGDYRLILTAFDRADPLTPLTAYAPDGVALGPSLDLGAIRVERPPRPPDPADVPMQVRLDASMGALILAGANLDRDEAAPGDPALVTLFWQVASGKWQVASGKWQVASGREQVQGDGGQADLRVHLALVDGGGGETMAWELPPVRDDWPTTLWQAGDLWRGQHLLRLPAGLESGTYTWQLYLYESTSPESRIPESPIALGQLRINAPERLWQAPPLQLPLDADLGQQVTLLGANLEPATAVSTALRPSTQLTVTLAWQARAEMNTSYRVFLHLLNPDGSLLTQSDGEPAGWTRPTTGWAPGEVVLDERILTFPADAPPGQYVLVTGLYDPDTGDRLALPDGATTVLVATIAVQSK
jgi:hypothetical protein